MNPYIAENEEGEHVIAEEPKAVPVGIPSGQNPEVNRKRMNYGVYESDAWQIGQDRFERYYGY